MVNEKSQTLVLKQFHKVSTRGHYPCATRGRPEATAVTMASMVSVVGRNFGSRLAVNKEFTLRDSVDTVYGASLAGGAARAEGQVPLSCAGTLLETRGQAETRRATVTLRASLSLEAEAATADLALDLLQQRLAAVRSALSVAFLPTCSNAARANS